MTAAISQPTFNSDYVEPDYPTSDGRPMGETDLHRSVMFDTINTLIDYFAGQEVYVTGNLLLYYEQGNRRKHVSPDCMVVRGSEMRPRDYYLLWEEGRSPNAVVEITSQSTRREDMKTKMELYRDVIGVREYFLFDPTSDYLKPRLQGYRLVNGRYAPIAIVEGRLSSSELALDLVAERHLLEEDVEVSVSFAARACGWSRSAASTRWTPPRRGNGWTACRRRSWWRRNAASWSRSSRRR